MPDSQPTRFIFVTGGVVSALGKGIASASIGRLLVSRGKTVTLQKFDPYINVDPGTMSPFQHGEVFVTEDGAETDLDLGHYERFTDVEHDARLERHAGRDLQRGHPARAPRRLPRRHRPGDPAHHRRDQGPDPARGRVAGRRLRDHRDRRHGRRHRVAAVPRGAAPVPDRARARALHVHPPDARAVPRPRRRAEDEADAALGPGAAPHRYPARHGRVPLRGGARPRHPLEDRAVREPAGRPRRLRARRRLDLQGAALLPRRGRRRPGPRRTSGSRPTRRTCPTGRRSSSATTPPTRPCGSGWSASTRS